MLLHTPTRFPLVGICGSEVVGARYWWPLLEISNLTVHNMQKQVNCQQRVTCRRPGGIPCSFLSSALRTKVTVIALKVFRMSRISLSVSVVGGSGMFDRCLKYTGKSFFGVHGDCQEPGTHLPQLLCQDSNIPLTSRAQTLTEHHLDQTHSVANSINASSPTTHYG
jgi:hypothetical protein